METVTRQPARSRITREDCLKFYGAGRTPEGLRAAAAVRDPRFPRIVAGGGDPEDTMRTMMLDLADGIEQLAAEGITPADCWNLLGWSPEFVEALLEDGAR